MKVLVTGSNGFTGKFLVPYLESKGFEVFGLSNHASGQRQYSVDLLDRLAVDKVIQEVQPDYVIHLAGIALPSFPDTELMYKINMFGTKNLLDSIQEYVPNIQKIIVASTAHVYGITGSGLVQESHPLQPVSHYGNSKLAMENIVRMYMDKLPLIITRPFNYTGKDQSTDYVIAKIIEHYRLGKTEISLGNIDVVRDFSYIDDVLYYYLQLINTNQNSFAVNLCSGVGTSIRQIIQYLDKITGCEMKVNANNALLRPQDNPTFIGDVEVLKKLTNDYKFHNVYEMLVLLMV